MPVTLDTCRKFKLSRITFSEDGGRPFMFWRGQPSFVNDMVLVGQMLFCVAPLKSSPLPYFLHCLDVVKETWSLVRLPISQGNRVRVVLVEDKLLLMVEYLVEPIRIYDIALRDTISFIPLGRRPY